jgi:sarcosine oxidase
VEYEQLNGNEAQAVLPFLHFPADSTFFLEAAPGGYINPRELIQAQLAVAQKQGAVVMRETAVSLNTHPDHISITTKEGQSYQSRQLLLATGAYSNCLNLLPRQLDLYVETETIVLAEVAAAEVARLQEMPAVIYQANLGRVSGFYMLPPIEYPNGRFYIKMGCGTVADKKLYTYDDIQSWMRSGDSDAALADMQAAMLGMLPGLAVQSWQTKRCLLTYTSHQKPFIGAVDEANRIFVVTGGNGTSAKSSDAIGHLAANLMLKGKWEDSLARELFQVEFEKR